MKKTLLQLLLLTATLLQARELKGTDEDAASGKGSGKPNTARTSLEKMALDSLFTSGWNNDTQGYDSVLYVYHLRDTHLQKPINSDIYIIKNNKRTNFRKSEASIAEYADSTVYTVLTYTWQENTKTWQNLWKDILNVQHAPLKSANLRYVWNKTSSEWAWGSRTIQLFDTQGHQLVSETYNWSTFIKKWEFFEKTDHTYNAQGQLTSKTNYSDIYNYLQWQLDDRDVYIYDANGKKLIDSLYYTPEDTITLYGTNQYSYDTKGRLLTEKIYNRSLSDTIQLKTLRDYSYPDSNLNAIVVVESKREGDALGLASRYVRIYDSGKKLTSETEYTWNSDDKVWEPSQKTVYTYNDGENPSFTVYDSQNNGQTWVVASFERYYYSSVLSGIREEDLKVPALFYPNPAKENITLNVMDNVQYYIYNAQGKVLLSGDGREIDLSELEEGTYLLRINDQGKMKSQKIVKN